MPYSRLPVLTLLLLILSACSNTPSPLTSSAPSVPVLALQPPYPALAAEFVTTRNKMQQHQHAPGMTDAHPVKEQLRWRFTREKDRLQIDNLSANTSEIWIRDGNAVFMLKAFHQDKRSVEYRSDDFAVLNIEPKWDKQALLLDPALFQQLKEINSGWVGKVPVRYYKGTVGNQQIEVEWRVDLDLPARIKRTSPDLDEETLLQNASDLSQAAWKPRDTGHYVVTDYADIGDMERDPFIMKVQSQLLGGDVHHH